MYEFVCAAPVHEHVCLCACMFVHVLVCVCLCVHVHMCTCVFSFHCRERNLPLGYLHHSWLSHFIFGSYLSSFRKLFFISTSLVFILLIFIFLLLFLFINFPLFLWHKKDTNGLRYMTTLAAGSLVGFNTRHNFSQAEQASNPIEKYWITP